MGRKLIYCRLKMRKKQDDFAPAHGDERVEHENITAPMGSNVLRERIDKIMIQSI